jgi:2-alkenal reductase
MNNRSLALIVGLGCIVLSLLAIVAVVAAIFIPTQLIRSVTETREERPIVTRRIERAETEPIPTLTHSPQEPVPASQFSDMELVPGMQSQILTDLYNQLNPGVVSIQVVVRGAFGQGGGAGSGFVLDEQGHIITNNHVVANAEEVTVLYYNGITSPAEVIGTDVDSDLAIIRVDELIPEAHPLALGDSDNVEVGEWVIAIGNPFGLGGSMTVGIVSALGRTIASETPFQIPQAIQTDAAINPGNSGGPLLNLEGQVIGVNAQIATGGGTPANAGVGFAIPVDIVRRIAPALIENGAYQWPWLGVEGIPVTRLIAQANDLETAQGAYINNVTPGGPADDAGLQGSSGTEVINGARVPVGGDVVIEANGDPIVDFTDLLINVTYSQPGEEMPLTILRNGERLELTVVLGERPMGNMP